MSLSSALSTAMAGMRANQAALSIVSSNVANAQTAGYVTQKSTQAEIVSGDSGSSVRVTGVSRQLDAFVQAQLRTEMSGAGYADEMSNALTQLQSVYGTPGDVGTLETTFSNFTASLQGLSSSSGNSAAQAGVLTAANNFAQALNSATSGIQTLRSNAEQNIGNSVSTANAALAQVADINARMLSLDASDPTASVLLDQRDAAITQLSQLMDLRVVPESANQVNLYTGSGLPLVSGQLASQFNFSAKGSLSPDSQWRSDPALSGVSALILKLPNGATQDVVATGGISSGSIGADLKLRDQIPVQAQTQIDQLAASAASALSDSTTAGTAVPPGARTGFDLDVSSVLPGNSLDLTYTDTTTNTQKQIKIVRVDDAGALPLPTSANTATSTTIGVNYTGGLTSVVSQLNAALGSTGLAFSNPAGSTLRVLDTASQIASVTAASTTTTATALTGSGTPLAIFKDGANFYTRKITASGSQMTGLAGRISVNTALAADPSKLTTYGATTATGDTSRADYLYQQLTAASFVYSPSTGLGSNASPLNATLTKYMQQVLSFQSSAATSASQLQQGQSVVVNTLQTKYNSSASVNIDTEMSNLIALQNTYAANAHVMSVVQTMTTDLLQTLA